MPVAFHCPECSMALQARDVNAGRKTRCLGCKEIIRIPLQSESKARLQPEESQLEILIDEESDPDLAKLARKSSKGSKETSHTSRKSKQVRQPSAPLSPAMQGLVFGGIAFVVIAGAGVGLFAWLKPTLPAVAPVAAPAAGPQFTPYTFDNPAVRMVCEMPTGATVNDGADDGIRPWAKFTVRGVTIEVSPLRSITDRATVMTTAGGPDERLKSAHLMRQIRLQQELNDFKETEAVIRRGPGNSYATSDFEYRGIFGKVVGIRATVIDISMNIYLVSCECRATEMDKWRPVVFHITETLDVGLKRPGADAPEQAGAAND